MYGDLDPTCYVFPVFRYDFRYSISSLTSQSKRKCHNTNAGKSKRVGSKSPLSNIIGKMSIVTVYGVLVSSLIQLKSSLIELESSLIHLESSLIQLESSLKFNYMYR